MAGEHIVIAEDDEGSRLLLSAFLEQGGYEVRVASNGLQALQLVRERLPNMVITDVNMPEMNGLELIRRLRSHHKMARIPVIMLSALTAPPQVLAGYAEGADDYVGKPVDLTVLGAKISALLARSSGERTPEGAGKVVLVQHAKGGVGATTLLVNLACLLEPLSVTGVGILDLKMGFGDVSRMLGVHNRLTLADLALQPVETVDDALFSKFVTEFTTGIHLVSGTERPEHAELVNVPAVQMAISRLQERYQYVLIDAPAAYDERAMAALDVADLVCVVTASTNLSLQSTADLLKLLRRLDINRARQVLILNHNRPDASELNAAEVLGERLDLKVAYTPAFLTSGDEAKPLAATEPDSEALEMLGEFAAGLADRLARSASRASHQQALPRTGLPLKA